MDFITRIDEKLKEKNLKRQAMYDDLKLNHSAITAWKKRGTIPSADICLKIADYLNVSVEWLLTGKEKNAPQFSQEEERFIEILRDLTEEQKRTIRILLEGYKNENKEFLKKVSE